MPFGAAKGSQSAEGLVKRVIELQSGKKGKYCVEDARGGCFKRYFPALDEPGAL